jgi:hypothetical protein
VADGDEPPGHLSSIFDFEILELNKKSAEEIAPATSDYPAGNDV